MASATRDHFSSRLGVLAATLGSAVGLGNIWKFPSLVGQNGGASFLVVYLLASLCIGLPLMISDLSLGRAGRSNVISIFQKLAPRTGWWLIGLSAIISCLLILGFSYFYSTIQFNPVEIANNLRKNNGAIPGIRPGKPTTDFIVKVLGKITFIGALFLGVVAVMPIVLGNVTGENISLGGTSLLIVVGVALDTSRSLESYMLMRHHKGFLE